MIKGMHGLLYSKEPEALRAFLKDKLKLPFTDTGGGWLIFDLPEADLGVHPTDGDHAMSGTHDLSFYTDDLKATMAELEGRGVTFDHPMQDHGYGFVTHVTMPGGVRMQIYQPKYTKSS
jgi:predicted enzyme related to lactoylglutathione lyase